VALKLRTTVRQLGEVADKLDERFNLAET